MRKTARYGKNLITTAVRGFIAAACLIAASCGTAIPDGPGTVIPAPESSIETFLLPRDGDVQYVSAYPVSGHWTREGSPYRINADIYVRKGERLVIDPGVRAEFQGRYRFRLLGGVKAVGRADARIVLTTTEADAALGDDWIGWRGIRVCGDDYDQEAIDHGARTWDFEFCEIAYVDKRDGVQGHPWEDIEGSFYAHGASETDFVFDDNYLHHGRSALFAYYGASNSVLMAEPVFRRNAFGRHSHAPCISVCHAYPSGDVRVGGEPTYFATKFAGGSASDFVESDASCTVAYCWDTPVILDGLSVSGCGEREDAPWFYAVNETEPNHARVDYDAP